MVWCGDENTPYKILTCPYYFRGCGSWFNKIRWKYVRVIASGPQHSLVEMKMSNGGIKIWYDLLQPSFVIRTTRKVRIVLRPRMSFSLQASILMEQGKNFATRRGLLIKTDGQIIRLEGKMINNGYVEWNINNGESSMLIYSRGHGRAEKNPGRQPS